MSADEQRTLFQKAAKGVAWSGVSTIALRLGGFVVGIVLARILTPEEFGTYAVALTVLAILMAVADLGLSADLIRSEDPERKAPTVATLGLVIGALLTVITAVSAPAIAELLGSPEAAQAIAIMSIALVLAGAGVVPYAMLQRRFQQRELFVVALVDLIVSTTVTLLLIAAGFGVLALAIGRVVAQLISIVMQFALARVRPRYRIDASVVGPVLAFGLPIAAANLLSWALLNVDNVILARVAGTTALGFYVLAFNVSNWPMGALSQVVRSISLPYFSRAGHGVGVLPLLVAFAWAAALPAGAVLAVLSEPLIEVVYGPRWLPAAPVLAALGLFGSLRVPFDVFAGYLYARGRSRPVLWVQLVWLVALVAGMVVATREFGIVGAGWVHVFVAVVVVLPAYAIALRVAGVRFGGILRASWWPTVATIPAAASAWLAVQLADGPVAALLLGAASAALVYALTCGPWLLRRIRALRGDGVLDERAALAVD